jgi:hypothetical protein
MGAPIQASLACPGQQGLGGRHSFRNSASPRKPVPCKCVAIQSGCASCRDRIDKVKSRLVFHHQSLLLFAPLFFLSAPTLPPLQHTYHIKGQILRGTLQYNTATSAGKVFTCNDYQYKKLYIGGCLFLHGLVMQSVLISIHPCMHSHSHFSNALLC